MVLAAAGVLSFALAACGSSATSTVGLPAKTVDSESPSPSAARLISQRGDWSVLYTSLPQLVKESPVIVAGRVTGVSYFDVADDDGYLNTHTKVSLLVTRVVCGDVKVDDTLTLVEPGGVTNEAAVKRSCQSKFPGEVIVTSEDEQTPVEVRLEGFPTSKVGDQLVCFAAREDTGEYWTVGAFQGLFTVVNGVAERYVPPGWGENSSSYGPLAMSFTSLLRLSRSLSTTRDK